MEWLKIQYEQNPEALCINNWTFKEVYIKVISLARKLNRCVEQEPRIGLLMENSPESVLLLYALLLLKKEVLMLNIRLTEKEIYDQTEKLNIKTVISSKNQYLDFEDITRLPEQEIELDWETDEEQIAVIMNTSATTGSFKSVPIRWKQVYAHVKASAQVLGVFKEDNWLVILPIFHVGGLSILFRSLYNGTRVTICKYKKELVLELIKKGSVNMVSMVPTMLKDMINDIQENRLRMLLLGGEFIPQLLIYRCMEIGIPVYKTYGMTETFSQSTTFNILEFPEKIDSVGKPLPGVKIFIKNPDKDGIGEIWLKSPMLINGYMGRKVITGYFNTKDIGYLDKEGFLYILNRREDIIISGGENIYPKEIEDLLYQMQGIKECAVVGQEDERWGYIPVLYIVSELPEEIVRNYLEGKLAGYKVPKKILYRKELPKNASGKIVRKLLQEKL